MSTPATSSGWFSNHLRAKAPRRDRPAVGSGLVKRRLHEPDAETTAAELIEDLGVNEDQAPTDAPMDNLRLGAVGPVDEATLIGLVHNHGLERHQNMPLLLADSVAIRSK